MINFVGRLFVLLVFVFSLGFLALAVGVYANHLNFKSKDVKNNPGIIDKLEEQIKQQAYARDRAKARYDLSYTELQKQEDLRRQRQNIYVARLETLTTGKDDKGNVLPAPVVGLVIGADGLVDLRAEGQPIMVRGQPLQALVFYQQQLAARHKDITDEQAKVDEQQALLASLSLQMQGGPNPMDPNRPIVGLIRQKEIMTEGRNRAIAQREYLKPLLANRYGEAVIVLKREKELRERLGQPEKTGTGRAEGQ